MDHSMWSQGPAGSSGGAPHGEGQYQAKNKKPTPRGQGKGKKAEKSQGEDGESILSQESQEPAGSSGQVAPSEQLTGKKKRVHRSKGSELRKKENRERRRREEREAAAAAAVEAPTAINSPPRSPSPNTVQPSPGSSSGSDTPTRDISAELSEGLAATAQAFNKSFGTTTTNNPPPVPISFPQAPGAREEQSGSADKGKGPEAAGSPSSGESTSGAFTFDYELYKESDAGQESGCAVEAQRDNENKEHRTHPDTFLTSAAEHKDSGWESQDKNTILPPTEAETPLTSGGDNSDNNKSVSEIMAAAEDETDIKKLHEIIQTLERQNAGLAADVEEQNAEATKHSERADTNLKASADWEKKFNEANNTIRNLQYDIRHAEITMMNIEKDKCDMEKALKDSEAAKTALTKNLEEALVEAKQNGDTLKEVHATSNEKCEELMVVKRERDDLKNDLDTVRLEIQGVEAAFDELFNNNTELQQELGLIKSQLEEQRKELEHGLGLQVAKRDMPGEQTPASANPTSRTLEDELNEAGDTNEEDLEPGRAFALIPDNLGKEFTAKLQNIKLFNSEDLRALDAASFAANWNHWNGSGNPPPAHPHYNRSFVRFMINAFTGEQIIGLEAVIHWYAESRVRGFYHNLLAQYYVDRDEIWRIPDEHQPNKRMESEITEAPYPPEDIPDPPPENAPPKVGGSTQNENYRAENSNERIQIPTYEYGGMFGEFDDEDVELPEDGRPWIITDENGEVPNIRRPGRLKYTAPSNGEEEGKRDKEEEEAGEDKCADGDNAAGLPGPSGGKTGTSTQTGGIDETASGSAINLDLVTLREPQQPPASGENAEVPANHTSDSGGGGDDPPPPGERSGTADDQQRPRPSWLHSPFYCLATLITDLLQWFWYWARRLYTLIFGGYLSTIRFRSPITFSDEVNRSPLRPNIPKGFWIWLNLLIQVTFMLATAYAGYLWLRECHDRNMWREANGVTQYATSNWRDDQIAQKLKKARRLNAEVDGDLGEASSLLVAQNQTFNWLLHGKTRMSGLNDTQSIPVDVLKRITSRVVSQHSTTSEEQPVSQRQSESQEGQESITSTDQSQQSKKSFTQTVNGKFSKQRNPFVQAFKGIFSKAKPHFPTTPRDKDQTQQQNKLHVPASQDENHAQRNEKFPGTIGIVISQANSPLLNPPQGDPVPTGPKNLIQRMLEAVIPQFIPKVSMNHKGVAALNEHTQMEMVYETQASSGIRNTNGHQYFPESKSMREMRENDLPRWARVAWYYLKHSNKLLPRGSWKNEDVIQPWQEPWEEWIE